MGAQAARCGSICSDLRALADSNLRIDLPVGQKNVACENLSTPSRKNIPLRDCPKSNLQFALSRPTRGAYRDRHGRWAGDAMDAHRRAQSLRGRTAFVRTAKSCGPGAPMQALSWWKRFHR